MLKKSPTKRPLSRLNSIENYSPKLLKSTQTNSIETFSRSTNTPNYFDEMLNQGKQMTNEQFENFLQAQASDCYWKILAERTRIKLDDQLRENRQLHELLGELTKENEQLQARNEHCEYLAHVFNSITSEYDSGIELHVADESPIVKRQKTHM